MLDVAETQSSARCATHGTQAAHHDNRQYPLFSHLPPTPRQTALITATLSREERRVDFTVQYIGRALITQHIGQVGQRATDHFVLALQLNAATHRLEVQMGLRKHPLLNAGVENLQYCLEYPAYRDRFAAGTFIG